MRVVCFGDSISAGQYVEASAWPRLLGQMRPEWDVVGAGVSNETTRQMLERFPRDVQESEADIVVLQAGHNDCNRWETDRWLPRVSRGAFRENLSEMIDRCFKFQIRPVLVNMTPTMKSVEYEAAAFRYSDIVGVVASMRQVPMVDVRSLFQRELNELLIDDGIHLSAMGHAVYASAVCTGIEGLS